MSELLCNAFWVAVLLTGDAARAEEVVRDAIEFLDADDLSTDALLIFVSTLALQLGGGESAGPVLPEEMANVMRLPRMMRQCFVLRILLGFPEGRCARMMHAEEWQISEAVVEAVSRLSFAAVVCCCDA
jgi:DNA-directed RNA polymerase specialized sigma24 family protein